MRKTLDFPSAVRKLRSMAKQRPPGAGASLGERAWWAYQCRGAPPYLHLEREHGFSVGQLRRLLTGERRGAEHETVVRVSRALQVPVEWLLEGRGAAPMPIGPVPPWPGHDAVVVPKKRRVR